MFMRGVQHRIQLIERPHRAAAGVCRLLHGEQALGGYVAALLAQRSPNRRGVELAALALESQDQRAGERAHSTALVLDDVGGFVGQNLVAGTAVRPDRDLIAHRARRQKHRRLLAEQRGHAVAERVHGRIVAMLFVTDLGADHGFLHRR
jgi:hypothetical protein